MNLRFANNPRRRRSSALETLSNILLGRQLQVSCSNTSTEKKCQSPSDVQHTLSAAVPFGIIPQENSITGSVVETYNVLRGPVVGQETFVRGATVFAVKHSLVARRGVKLENIERVLSHEQVRSCRLSLDSISRSPRLWASASCG